MTADFQFAGASFRLDAMGALWWEARRTLVVADLHLEKGSALARRGMLLPPYDTHATLARLARLVAQHRPAMVVSLGDGFHDMRADEALDPWARERLRELVASVRWIWIEGNHDPRPPAGLGGEALPVLELDGIVLRHHANGSHDAEIVGHLHPKARVGARGRAVSRPCFAADPSRLLLPAFGAYAGGLNVLAPSIARLFPSGFDAFLLGESRVLRLPHTSLRPEPDVLYRNGRPRTSV